MRNPFNREKRSETRTTDSLVTDHHAHVEDNATHLPQESSLPPTQQKVYFVFPGIRPFETLSEVFKDDYMESVANMASRFDKEEQHPIKMFFYHSLANQIVMAKWEAIWQAQDYANFTTGNVVKKEVASAVEGLKAENKKLKDELNATMESFRCHCQVKDPEMEGKATKEKVNSAIRDLDSQLRNELSTSLGKLEELVRVELPQRTSDPPQDSSVQEDEIGQEMGWQEVVVRD
jgi:hypothetical protein